MRPAHGNVRFCLSACWTLLLFLVLVLGLQMCRRGLKEFHFYLFNDLLLYTGEGGVLGSSHRQIPLSHCRVRCVVSPKRCYSSSWHFIAHPARIACAVADTERTGGCNSRSSVSEMPHGFKVQSKEKSFLVRCHDDAERDGWIEDMQRHINVLAQTTKRKCVLL